MTVGRPDTLTFKWLAGILITIVLALVALWAQNLSAQVSTIETKVDIQSAATADIQGQLKLNAVRLQRIESNQDRVMLAMPRGR